MEIRSEEIFELCDTINQPIFIQRNEKNNLVLMFLKYYKEQHFDDIWSIPAEIWQFISVVEESQSAEWID